MQNCRNRYFLILDEKFIDGLLLLPPSEEYLSPMICLKVFDADFGLPGSYFGKEIKNLNDSGDDEEGDSSDEYNYEGWFWTRAESLKKMWSENSRKERHSEVYTWDKESRPVRQET